MNIPQGYAYCPVCNGTGQGRVLSEQERKMWFNAGKTHEECRNCGGQTMMGKALGYTPIDPNTGQGCIHEYTGRQAGRCYYVYNCTKCSFKFDIDSGD